MRRSGAWDVLRGSIVVVKLWACSNETEEIAPVRAKRRKDCQPTWTAGCMYRNSPRRVELVEGVLKLIGRSRVWEDCSL